MTGPKRVTEKQLAANRANAQRSTGPRTPEGKAIVSQNAIKHGILAQAIIPRALAPYESREHFDRLLDVLCGALSPVGPLERMWVQQVAVAYWRLARLYRAEAGVIAQRQEAAELDLARAAAWAKGLPISVPDAIEQLEREERDLRTALSNSHDLRAYIVARAPSLQDATDEELVQLARNHLIELDRRITVKETHRQDIEDAVRSIPEPDVALKFARYETALQNQLDRALSRLERLQRLRGGEPVTPPLHIDVTGVEVPNDN